jgi:rhodanese-related sulfurtransferase
LAQNPRFEKLAAEALGHVREVSPTEAHQQQRAGALLVDVREADEFARGHAEGSVHLSRGVLELKIEQVAPDAQTPIVCYCGGGKRSALAAESLARMGYSNVASLEGGFKAWRDADLPTA